MAPLRKQIELNIRLRESTGHYEVQLRFRGKTIHVGTYTQLVDARTARDDIIQTRDRPAPKLSPAATTWLTMAWRPQ